MMPGSLDEIKAAVAEAEAEVCSQHHPMSIGFLVWHEWEDEPKVLFR